MAKTSVSGSSADVTNPYEVFIELVKIEIILAEVRAEFPGLAGTVYYNLRKIEMDGNTGFITPRTDIVRLAKQYVDWSYKVGKGAPQFVHNFKVKHPTTGEEAAQFEAIPELPEQEGVPPTPEKESKY